MTQTVYTHLSCQNEPVRLLHRDRSMRLVEVTRGHPILQEKVELVPEITAALERIVVGVE